MTTKFGTRMPSARKLCLSKVCNFTYTVVIWSLMLWIPVRAASGESYFNRLGTGGDTFGRDVVMSETIETLVTSVKELHERGIVSFELAKVGKNCGGGPGFLGFWNRTCSDSPQTRSTAGPVLRTKSAIWNQWILLNVTRKDDRVHARVKAHIPENMEAKCSGVIQDFFDDTCKQPPYGNGLFLEDMCEGSMFVEFSQVPNSDFLFQLVAVGRPPSCARFIGVQGGQCGKLAQLLEEGHSRSWRSWKIRVISKDSRGSDVNLRTSTPLPDVPSPPERAAPSPLPAPEPSPSPPNVFFAAPTNEAGNSAAPEIKAPSFGSHAVAVNILSAGGDATCIVASITLVSGLSGQQPQIQTTAVATALQHGMEVTLQNPGYYSIYAYGNCEGSNETTATSAGITVYSSTISVSPQPDQAVFLAYGRNANPRAVIGSCSMDISDCQDTNAPATPNYGFPKFSIFGTTLFYTTSSTEVFGCSIKGRELMDCESTVLKYTTSYIATYNSVMFLVGAIDPSQNDNHTVIACDIVGNAMENCEDIGAPMGINEPYAINIFNGLAYISEFTQPWNGTVVACTAVGKQLTDCQTTLIGTEVGPPLYFTFSGGMSTINSFMLTARLPLLQNYVVMSCQNIAGIPQTCIETIEVPGEGYGMSNDVSSTMYIVGVDPQTTIGFVYMCKVSDIHLTGCTIIAQYPGTYVLDVAVYSSS